MPYGMEQILVDHYRPRNPRDSDYYRCTQDHFEQLERVWDDRYERRYGFWHPYVMDVILRYLECGDLHFGFARAIHENSARAGGPFVVVDCAALPETLVESILLGHVKGAFTGAEADRQGLVMQARQGTLFLDEVGQLPLDLQKAFLRVLEEKRVRPLGSAREVACDFRLMAATNRDLEQMVAKGAFRSDLFFRLQSVSIAIAPLRKRVADIRAIAMYHLQKLCERFQMEQKGVSTAFFETLEAYRWPGNVRELVNALRQALLIARNDPTLYRCTCRPKSAFRWSRRPCPETINLLRQ